MREMRWNVPVTVVADLTLTLRRRACEYDPSGQSIEGKVKVIRALLFDMASTIVNLLQIGRMAASEKDPEILILRKQLAMLERRQTQPPRLTRVEKLSLMGILLRLRLSSRRTLRQLGESIRIVKPETILRLASRSVALEMETWRAAKGRVTAHTGCIGAARCAAGGGEQRLGLWQNPGRAAQAGLSPEPGDDCADPGTPGYPTASWSRAKRGLAHLTPIPHPPASGTSRVSRRETLGGVIGDYYKDTA